MFGVGIRVRRLFIRQTGTYNPIYRRPYESHMDQGTVNTFHERLSTGKITPATMSGIASGMATPSVGVEGSPIHIPNGWNERRMCFMLEVEINEHLRGTTTEIIQGYTDFPGVTINGSIAPDMEFYINSILQISSYTEYTPMGPQVGTRVVDASHLLVNNNFNTIYDQNQIESMRPQDVFSMMNAVDLFAVDSEDCRNQSNLVSSVATKSNRGHALPTSYVSQILDTYKTQKSSMGFNMSFEELIQESRNCSSDASAPSDRFLGSISELTGRISSNMFRFADLVRLDSNTPNVTTAMITGEIQQVSHQVGQTQGWNGSDGCTHMASALCQSIPAMLSKYGITNIAFNATNRVITGEPVLVVSNVESFISGDIGPLIDSFIFNAKREIFYDISYCNMVDYAVSMRVDLLGETWISISVAGSPIYDYVMPSFADALAVPVITGNKHVAMSLANDFQTLLSEVIGANDSIATLGNGNYSSNSFSY